MIRYLARFAILLISFASKAGTAWQSEYARQIDDVRTGMTVEQVKRVVTLRPFASRVYKKANAEIFEWSFPTAENRWTTLVFEDAVLRARQDKTSPTYPRQKAATSPEDVAKRKKLSAVQIGQPVSTIDAIGLVPTSTVTSANVREMLASPDLAKISSDVDAVGSAMGATATLSGMLGQLDPATFDEIRSYELLNDTVSIFIKDAYVVELQIAANPDEQWVLTKLASVLASKKPTSKDFEQIKPGMTAVQVIMLVGIPASEDKKTTAEGTESTLRYKLSRKDQVEIQIRNDMVVSITKHASY